MVYGGKNEAQCVELETHAIEQVLHHHSSESILLDIELEGEGVTAVLIKEVQHHPVTGALVHVDMQRVSANKPIQVEVPLELKGEPEGVKAVACSITCNTLSSLRPCPAIWSSALKWMYLH